MNNFILHLERTGGSSLANAISKSGRLVRISAPKNEKEIIKKIEDSKIKDPIVMSHFLFGLDNSLLNAKYHTVIRNPIHMSISVWLLHHNYKHMHLHKESITYNISEFYTKTKRDNFICRSILGYKTDNGKIVRHRGNLVESDLDKVIDILQTYETVENYENYDLYIKKLSKKIGFELNLYKLKFTLAPFFTITKQEYYELKDILKFDCELYRRLFNIEPTHEYIKE